MQECSKFPFVRFLKKISRIVSKICFLIIWLMLIVSFDWMIALKNFMISTLVWIELNLAQAATFINTLFCMRKARNWY